jgi:outer membrane receptor protein involved in Fe transport
MIMRGMGTLGGGVHFEPGVGQQINGFYSTRSRLGRAALVDLEQVEVLRGPQGSIIGKNTSLGAINIRTNQPTDHFEAKVSTQYSFLASEGPEVEGMISGPLTDRLRARAVVNYVDVDGWIRNRATGDKQQEREDFTGRIMVDYDFTDNITGQFMYQRTDFDRDGKMLVRSNCPDPALALAVFGLECKQAPVNSRLNLRDGVDIGEPFRLKNDFFGVTLNWDLGKFRIQSLTSFFDYVINDDFDADHTEFELDSFNNEEHYDQFMQEVRLESSFGDDLDYTLGVMYFKSDMNFTQQFHTTTIGSPAVRPAARNEFAESETESGAVFGEATWRINDRFTFSLGGRFTNERRTGARAQMVGPIFGDVTQATPEKCGTGGFFACTRGNDNAQPFGTPTTGKIDKDDFSLNTSLSYEFLDDQMLYISYATGFKSGGFDLRGFGDPDKFTFPHEASKSFEVGGKHTLFNNTFRVNWTAFYMTVDDLQISSIDPVLFQQIVANPDVKSKGVELDVVWAATDALTLTFAGAYLDAEYDGDFIATCFIGQTASLGCTFTTPGPPGVPDPRALIDGAAAGFQNLAGQRTNYAPEWSFVAGGEYVWRLPAAMDLKLGAKYVFSDKYWTNITQNPGFLQGSTGRVDASLILSGTLRQGNPWTIGLIGKNLNNEFVSQFTTEGIDDGVQSTMTMIEQTRYVALRATIGF